MMKTKTIFNKFKVKFEVINKFQCSVLIKELESFTKMSESGTIDHICAVDRGTDRCFSLASFVIV